MTLAQSARSIGDAAGEAVDDLHRSIYGLSMLPFWKLIESSRGNALEKLEERMKSAVPHVWKFSQVHDCLQRADALIKMDDPERRYILLANPGLAGSQSAVSTISAAYQMVNEHGVRSPHRHSTSGIRFGLYGRDTYISVNGQKLPIRPGDLVLNPSNAWHFHGSAGEGPTVAFIAFDMPLIQTLNSLTFERAQENAEGPSADAPARAVQEPQLAALHRSHGLIAVHERDSGERSPANSIFSFPWEHTEEALAAHRDREGSLYDAILLEYRDPATGAALFPTMTFFAQLLRRGERTLPQRQHANRIYTVFSGAGHSIVDGKRLDWDKFDTFVVPGGKWCEHVCGDGADAVLLVTSDEPALRALGCFAKAGRNKSGDIVNLA